MTFKDPEKRREYQRQWRKEHPSYHIEWVKKKYPNVKRRDFYYDFETHRELAINLSLIHI